MADSLTLMRITMRTRLLVIAPPAVFLASEEAGWVTGSTVNADEGHIHY
jgi:NAD(P)-dependent dehydrogenase (short-subunit alcohol dehydrogenase family)